MFDELLSSPDMLDCIMEIHNIKEEVKSCPNEALVDYIVELSSSITITLETEMAIDRFFNKGNMDEEDRQLLENCYVLLKNYLCVSTGGEIYQTLIVNK